MRLIGLITAITLFLSTIPNPLIADRGVGSIEISANPVSIPADGKSTTTITARVRDSAGNFVPDGTEIRFSASLGIIEETASTTTGVARVKLTSADIDGTSIITATWIEGQAVAQLNVDFGESQVVGGQEYISISGDDYLAYSADYKTFEAIGNVKIRYHGLKLLAHEAQVDIEKGRIVAHGRGREEPIKIELGESSIEAQMFMCELTGSRGIYISSETSSAHQIDITKQIPEKASENAEFMPEEFDFTDMSDSAIVIKASEATVFLNQKIQFKRAKIYVDGKRTIALPLYVLSLTGYPEDGEQYIGYSTGGLTLNLPIYYNLSPTSTGTFLVRHGEKTGWGDYGQKPGWFLDMRQKYSTEHSEGSLVLSQISDQDWGAHLSHSQDLGNDTHSYLYLDYPSHRDLFGSMNLSKSFKDFSAGININTSQYKDIEDSWFGDLYFQTKARPIGKLPLKYTISTRTAYSTNSMTDGNGLSQSLRGNISSLPIPLTKSLSLRTSLALGYVWSDVNTAGLSTQAAAIMDWKTSKNISFNLSYRFANKPSVYTTTVVGSQTLSANLNYRDKKLRASVYAIKGLDYPSTNLFASLGYQLDPKWRLGIRSTLNDYGDLSYNDLELEVGRVIGNRELIAVWSKSQGKIMFELGSSGF